MASKVQKIKTERPSDNKKLHELSYVEKVATLSGCTPQYVRRVLKSPYDFNGAKAMQVIANAERIRESDNKLLKAVKKLVPFGDSKLFIEQQQR